MDVVLVRHATRNAEGELTDRGSHQVDVLARALAARGVRASVFLTSDAPYAEQTCARLAELIGTADAAGPRVLGPLVPEPGNPSGLENLIDAAQHAGIGLGAHDVVVVVGHEGHLSNLVTELTGARHRPIPRGGAVSVRGTDLATLLKGRGCIDFRFPVVDHQEKQLRPKVQSKLTVATFLAGFVSAALISTVFADRFSPARQGAAVLLTMSLALFIVTVYLYDQLGMPEGFWLGGRRRAVGRKLERHRERRLESRWIAARDTVGPGPSRGDTWLTDERERRWARADEAILKAEQDGPLYTSMVATWQWVFTPGVICALLGFGLLIFDAGTSVTGIACAAVVLLALGWFTLRTPALGTD